MQRAGITESSISNQLSGLLLVPGIRELIETSHERGLEIIVLSDNLTFFVEKFLESSGLRQVHVKLIWPSLKVSSFSSGFILQFEEPD
jgi:phosphoserine phosphatase